MKKILILEDFADSRAWLCDLIREAFGEVEIKEAATVAQARHLLEENAFDLALIDLNLPDGSGLEVINAIRRQTPATYCVVATIFDDDQHLLQALQAGAHGYLLKEQPKEQLLTNLQGILNGEPPLSPQVARRIIRYFHTPAEEQHFNELSKREVEILTLVAKGYNRNEIAEALSISAYTVASHVRSIYKKLDISSKSEATLEAIRLGLIRP